MADHFFAILPGNVESAVSDPQKFVIVGTSTAGPTYIEVRVPDALAGQAGTVGDRQRMTVQLAMEALEQYFNNAVRYTTPNWPIGG